MSETLRKDRKGISKPLKDKKLKRNELLLKLPKNVVIFRWSDKRYVNAISNAHTNKLKQTTNWHKKEPVRPNVLIDYNCKHVGNRPIRPMLWYNFSMRKTVRWYKMVGTHILEILLILLATSFWIILDNLIL